MPATVSNFPIATPQKSQGFYSFRVQIDNDDFYSCPFPGLSGFLFVSTNSATYYGSMNWLRGSAAIKVSGAADYQALSTALNGTTGSVGDITVSASGGLVYIENRSSQSRDFTVTLLCDNTSVE
jgi:hypothetical protein